MIRRDSFARPPTKLQISLRALPACLALLGVWLAAGGVCAAPADPAPEPKTGEMPASESLVALPSHSPRVEDNGCLLLANPTDKPTTPYFVPLFELAAYRVGRYAVQIIIADGDKRQAFLDAIRPLDQDTRTLATLYLLWQSLGRDGLHTFFYMGGGAIAPEVRDALKAAGLDREHGLFTSAMALFGPNYPIDNAVRAASFGYSRGRAELDPFDYRLLAIAHEFPSRTELATRIETFVASRPELWRSIEATRRTVGNQRRVTILLEQLWHHIPGDISDEGVHGALIKLPETERNLIAMDAFNLEFENGGIHQFFFNSTGAFAPDVYTAMLALGLTQQAQLLKRGMDLFATPYPRNRAARIASYHGGRDVEGFESELSDLTEAFYAIGGGLNVTHLGGDTQISGGPGIRDALARYAAEHKLLPC